MTFVGPPNFKPGTSYRYSNTNFVLAGLIAERVGEAKLGEQIHSNFIDPLKLTHTFFGGDDSITMTFAHNWSPFDSTDPAVDYYDIDKTAQLTGSWGAGNMVSTTGDLTRWVNLLYTGQIVSKSALAQMMSVHYWTNYGIYYGLGTQRAPDGTKFLYGHGGSLIGFKSAMWTNPKDSVSIALYMNSDAIYKDAAANDYVVDVLNEIYRITQGVTDEGNASVPISVTVFPNPSSDHATFYFRTNRENAARLTVFDELGRPMITLLDQILSPGIHSASCDVSHFRSGTYFYRLQSGSEVVTGKIFIQ